MRINDLDENIFDFFDWSGKEFKEYLKFAKDRINRYPKNLLFRMLKKQYPEAADTDLVKAVNMAKEEAGHADRISFKESQQMNYDVVEDTIIFMKNDPMFYRKEFFPAINKIAEIVRAGKTINKNQHLTPMIEKGCDAYTSRYHQGKTSEEIFTPQDRSDLMQSIYSTAIEEIDKGEYK